MGSKTATTIIANQTLQVQDSYVLPAMGVKPNTISMSGQSSGSYMTNHMQVLHSERIKGYGMMEGGPYHVGAIWGVTEDY